MKLYETFDCRNSYHSASEEFLKAKFIQNNLCSEKNDAPCVCAPVANLFVISELE